MPDDKKTDEEARKAEEKRRKEQEKRMTSLENSLSGLSENMKKFMTGLEGLGNKIESLQKSDDKSKSKPSSDVNLETLDRSGFLNVILERVGSIIEEKITPIHEDVTQEKDRRSQESLAKQVKDAEKAHRDFWDWKEEMGEIAKRSPGLNVEEIYQLARIEHKDKAVEMDDKYKTDEEREKEKQKAESKNKPKEVFGGLTPTSGKTAEVDNMTMDEAANKAYDEVFGAGAE